MWKIIWSIIAIAMSYLLIYGISNVLEIEAWWLSLMICFCCGYPILYLGRSHHWEEQTMKQEYIMDLHNDKLGEIFTRSKYPNYKKERSGNDGNDYISDTGAILCTKYVEEMENVKVKERGISIHLFCILICIFSFFLWMSIIHTGNIANRIEDHSEVIIRNIYNLKGDGMERMILIKRGNLLVRGGKEIAIRFGENATEMLKDIKNVF